MLNNHPGDTNVARIVDIAFQDSTGTCHIVAATVSRIVRSAPDTGGATHTQVDYAGGIQLTAESGAAMNEKFIAAGVRMLPMTAPDGTAIYLNADAISAVREAYPGEEAAGTNAVVIVGGDKQAVKETPAAVLHALQVLATAASRDTRAR